MKVSAQLGRLRAGFSISLLAAFLPLQAQTPQNLLTNGSFETNSHGPAAAGWTITNSLQSGPYGEYSLTVRPEAGASNGASFALWNAGDSTPSASIAQTFTTTPGTSYTLKFDYVGGPSWRPDLQSLDVTVSNSDLGTQLATGDSSGNWKTFTYTFKATSTSSTLTFTDDLNNVTFSEDGALDNVVITANPPTVYASGISAVTTWDPIFPPGPILPDTIEGKPAPTIVYSDPRWTNQHAAFVFPLGSHPWEGIVPYNFSANWINAWAGGGQLNTYPGLESNRHGKTSSSAGWAGYPYFGVPNQSYTKYSTTVVGEGEFVLQFLADNASWIYIDGALVGFQDYGWQTNGTGRYLITLAGAGAHDLGFVIWDGGGLAGGKFRLETRASFEANNPGVTLPPRAASVTLSNLTKTYDGTPKSATVTTAPGGLTTSVTYNGSTTAPTNVGSYAVVATVTSSGYSGSTTGTLTIGKANATITLGNLTHTYDGTAKSATATTSPAGLGVTFNSGNSFTNAGSYAVIASISNPSYNASTTSDNLVIAKAPSTTTTIGAGPFTYDGTTHSGGSGTVTGTGGLSAAATSLTYSGDRTNAGTYTVTAHYAGDANHEASDGAPVTITINKATSSTTTVGAGPFTYDGTTQAGGSGTVTGAGVITGTATVTYAGDQVNTGSYTVTAHYAGDTNHEASDGAPVTITINKATSSTTTVGAGPFTYDGTTHTGGSGTVTGAGTITGSATLSYTGNQISAGSYSVTAHYAGDANHTASDGASVTNTINKATSNTTTVGAGPFTYDATTHTGGSGTVSGAGTITGSATLSYAGNQISAGSYTVTAHYAGDANHTASDGAPVSIAITKATATVTVTPYNVTYNGLARLATATVAGVNSETGATVGTVSLTTTHTNAGTYTDSWSFTGGANYKDIASTSITDTIAKAAATIVVTPYTAEYDGLAHSATATITGENGETGATVGAVTLNTTHTTVGTYGTDSWSFTGTANYNNIAATTITDKIKDTTAPVITATMTAKGGGDDESTQSFTIAFSATDLVGVKTLTAVLNGITVTNSQIVQLQVIKSGKQESEKDDGKLKIKATAFSLVVTSTDAAGNVSIKTIVPVFVKNGKDSEDKNSDDKSGKDK